MPLDPQAAAFLQQASTQSIPSFGMAPVNATVPAGAVAVDLPECAVDRVEDRTIPGPGGELPIRVYLPAGAGPHPVLVYLHGGGWVMGDLDSHDGLCRCLCGASRCAVIALDYRLAPYHKFPAALEDTYFAICWTAAHAAELNIDATRIAVGGDSAGGNLAAAACLMARDRGGPEIAFQVLLYPITDYAFDTRSYSENGEGYFLTRERMMWFWNHYLEREEEGSNPYASPLRCEDLSGLPPAFVLTTEFDPLRDEGEAYADRLHEAGVAASVRRHEGMIHGFLRRIDVFDRAREALYEIGDVLRQALRPELRNGAKPCKPR